jgi:hypothetical protein
MTIRSGVAWDGMGSVENLGFDCHSRRVALKQQPNGHGDEAQNAGGYVKFSSVLWSGDDGSSGWVDALFYCCMSRGLS